MKKLFKLVSLLVLTLSLALAYTHYIPLRVSNCAQVGGDSPEGLFLDGFYVFDGPNHETSGAFPYRLEYLGSWWELPSVLGHSFNGNLCEYWGGKPNRLLSSPFSQ